MSEFAKSVRAWEGLIAVVLGSGPSMSAEVCATVRASGAKTVAVNNQAIETNGHPALAPWADVLYAADNRWWYENKQAIKAFKGLKATIQPNNGMYPNLPFDDVRVYRNGGARGVDARPGYLRTGHNSGYQAVLLALDLGAARVVLCGFDMHGRNGQHWFGDHKWRLRYESRYELFVRAFIEGAPEMLKRAEIINATPDSALKCFKFKPLEEALRGVQDVRESAAVRPAAGQAEARGARKEDDRAEARA